MPNTFPNELKPGNSFTHRLFLCTNVAAGTGNGPKIRLTLNDSVQSRAGKIWTPAEGDLERLLECTFVEASGFVNDKDKYVGELTIDSFEAADTPDDITPFLPPPHADCASHQARFRALLVSVQEPHLRQLLELIFAEDKPLWPRFREAVAAKKKHHAYRGGLLHHTVEVAESCAALCTVYVELERDLAVTGALLHDIGKLDEMEHGLRAGEYTEAGVLSSHIQLGADKVARFIAKIPGFPPALRNSVRHMMESHHGRPEFGSPKPPMFSEARLLSDCDSLNAWVFQCEAARADVRGQKQVYLPGKDSIAIFTGDLGLQAPPETPAATEPARTFQTAPLRRAEPLPSFATMRLPVRGLAAAGTPEQSSDTEEDMHDTTLPAGMADFLVRVTGDSMVDVGIDEGDLLLIKRCEQPTDGDLVVAHLGTRGEVVKRLRYDGGAGWLHSENRAQNYPPLPTDSDTRIQGRIVGTLKGQ